MILSSLDLGLPPWEVVVILTGGLALSSFALSGIEPMKFWCKYTFYIFSHHPNAANLTNGDAGLYCTHQDISPEYASILLVCKLQNFKYFFT